MMVIQYIYTYVHFVHDISVYVGLAQARPHNIIETMYMLEHHFLGASLRCFKGVCADLDVLACHSVVWLNSLSANLASLCSRVSIANLAL